MDEDRLVCKLKNSDEMSFEYVIDSYGPRVLKTIFLIVRDKEEAEDIFQETFLKVHKKIRNFKGNSSLYTWIYSIAINECRDRYKYNKLELSLDETILHTKENTGDKLQKEIDKQVVRNEILKLSSIYREALVLFYYNDMSISEISKVTGEKEGTIKCRLSRGRNILKKSLEKEGF